MPQALLHFRRKQHKINLNSTPRAACRSQKEKVVKNMMENVKKQAEKAVRELIEAAGLSRGDLLVVGCSSSEIVGEHIGKGSSLEAAQAVYQAIAPVLKEKGIFLAAQCCEHLNRALVVEKQYAKTHGLEIVTVRPMPKAGGSFATTAYENFEAPVAVETVTADAGLDIGGTLIGMHLRRVAVPVRLSVKTIGQAPILCAKTRPKYIGGPRAVYPENVG